MLSVFAAERERDELFSVTFVLKAAAVTVKRVAAISQLTWENSPVALPHKIPATEHMT